jgi:hypothetical protein
MFILFCITGLFWYVAYKHTELPLGTPPHP